MYPVFGVKQLNHYESAFKRRDAHANRSRYLSRCRAPLRRPRFSAKPRSGFSAAGKPPPVSVLRAARPSTARLCVFEAVVLGRPRPPRLGQDLPAAAAATQGWWLRHPTPNSRLSSDIHRPYRSERQRLQVCDPMNCQPRWRTEFSRLRPHLRFYSHSFFVRHDEQTRTRDCRSQTSAELRCPHD